jgi:hypothetical protein
MALDASVVARLLSSTTMRRLHVHAGLLVASLVGLSGWLACGDSSSPSVPASKVDSGATTGTGEPGDDAGGTSSDGAPSDFEAGATPDANTPPASGEGGADAGDGGPPGTLIFQGDFETGDLSQWALQYPPGGKACSDGGAPSMTVYSAADAPGGAPPPRQGTYAVRFHTLNTDTNATANCTTTDNPRTQLQSSDSLEKAGDEIWEQWSTYFPATFPNLPTEDFCTDLATCWLLNQESYAAPFGQPPALGWDIETLGGDAGDSIALAHAGSAPLYKVLLTRGQWVDFLVHKKMSSSATDGYVEAWVAGVHVPKQSFATMNSGQATAGFYLSSYRAKDSILGPVDLYLDNAYVWRASP